MYILILNIKLSLKNKMEYISFENDKWQVQGDDMQDLWEEYCKVMQKYFLLKHHLS